MLKYDYYGIDDIGKGGKGDGGRNGSRHALGMLKYYYYEIDGAHGHALGMLKYYTITMR